MVNFSATAALGRVRFPHGDWGDRTGHFVDVFTGEKLHRPGTISMVKACLVDLLPWEAHVWVTRMYNNKIREVLD